MFLNDKKLIIIDGPNGSGKSSIIKQLTGCAKVFAPGFTDLGKILRPICRGTDNTKVQSAEALIHLFIADREETLYSIIHNLTDKVIVTDRWILSNIVYQCSNIDGNFNNGVFFYDTKVTEILDSISYTENKLIHDNMYYIWASPEERIKRIKEERIKNSKHGFDSWTNDSSLNIPYQEKLNVKYRIVFKLFSERFNKKTIELSNETKNDFTSCVNTIQKEIDFLNQN